MPRAGDFRRGGDKLRHAGGRRRQVNRGKRSNETGEARARHGGSKRGGVGGGLERRAFNDIARIARRFIVSASLMTVGARKYPLESSRLQRAMQRRREPDGKHREGDEAA